MGVLILFGSLGAAPVSSWLWEGVRAPSPLLPRSHINLQRSHPDPFAFSTGSLLPARPGADLHLCHSLSFYSHLSILEDSLSDPSSLFFRSTKHSPALQPQGNTTAHHHRKDRIPFQAPKSTGSLQRHSSVFTTSPTG